MLSFFIVNMFYQARFKNIFDAVIFSNLFISVSAVALTLCSYIVFYGCISSAPFYLLVFTFFSTLIIYNCPLIFSEKKTLKTTLKGNWVLKNYTIVRVIFIVSLITTGVCTLFISFKTILFLTHLAVLAIIYSFPIRIGNVSIPPLRKFPLAKIFILSYVWASVTVLIPAFESEIFLGLQMFIYFLERFLFILALAIPFDIRDFNEDRKYNILTIPVLIGVRRSKYLSIFLLLLFLLSSYMGHEFDFIFYSRALSVFAAIFIIYNIGKEAKEYAYMFWVDGVMIFQFLVLVVLRGV